MITITKSHYLVAHIHTTIVLLWNKGGIGSTMKHDTYTFTLFRHSNRHWKKKVMILQVVHLRTTRSFPFLTTNGRCLFYMNPRTRNTTLIIICKYTQTDHEFVFVFPPGTHGNSKRPCSFESWLYRQWQMFSDCHDLNERILARGMLFTRHSGGYVRWK